MKLRESILWLAFVLAGCAVTHAQDPVAAPDGPTIADLEKRIEAVKAAAGVDPAVVSATVEVLQKAITRVREAEAAAKAKAEFEADAASAPARLKAIQEALGRPPERLPVVHRAMTPEELETALRTARALETARIRALAEVKREPAQREARKVEVASLLVSEKRRLEDIEGLLAQPSPGGGPAELVEPNRLRLQAARAAVRNRIAAYEAELASYEARATLVVSRIQLAEREKDEAEKLAAFWQAEATRRAQEEAAQAEQRAEQARRVAEAQRAHPVIRELARRNEALTKRTSELVELTKKAVGDRTTARNRLKEIEDSEAEAKRRIELLGGLTEAIGVLLHQHRSRLGTGRLQERVRERRAELQAIQIDRIELEEESERLDDADAAVKRLLAQVDPEPAEAESVRLSLTRLVADRRRYIDDFVRESERYVADLAALDTSERQVIAKAEAYADFIDERVLWIRSARPLWKAGVADFRDGAIALVSAELWAGTGAVAFRTVRRRPVQLVALLLGVLALIGLRIVTVRRAMTPEMQEARGRSFAPTLYTLAAVILRALPVPAALWCIGWAVGDEALAEPRVRALAAGLQVAAVLLFLLGTLKRIAGALGEAHFGWRAPVVTLVTRDLGWFAALAVPCSLLVIFYDRAGDEDWHRTIGRSALILVLAGATVLAARLLGPTRGLLSPAVAESRYPWLVRLRWMWFLIVLSAPLGLLGLAIFGYHFTALALVGRLGAAVGLVVGLLLLNALVTRWIVLARRSLARQTVGETEDRTDVAAKQQAAADAMAVDAQTRQLVRTSLTLAAVIGAWFIWVDVLPALEMLREFDLWTHKVESVEDVMGSDGNVRPTPLSRDVPVTLADALAALIIMVLAVVAAKNLPGALEVAVLKRLPMDKSSRLALTTVVSYIISIVGFSIALGYVGFGWSKLQWLVAAMGVGLGFGLQEIFGNFVSGLIILFDRRVRVGDVVTIGDATGVSGTVTEIRVLATTVRDWDRKEYVVPNKDLVTGRLLNWTLSNEMNRILIRVGVAYGSDTEKARQILLDCAAAHPEVLEDPNPVATFEAFGESSLDLMLRCFLPELTHRLRTITELHEAVDREFKKAGLEIAFPQRDVHIHNATPEAPFPTDLEEMSGR